MANRIFIRTRWAWSTSLDGSTSLSRSCATRRRRRVSDYRPYSSEGLAEGNNEDAYLELWMRRQVKHHDFYEEEARRRHYFYTIDLQGRLFLEESPIKNITSCLKDNKFLDFFFTRIKINDTGFHPSYPFISMCGKEHNFILPADVPIVFHDMTHPDGVDGADLVYAGTRRVPFEPSALRISRRSHRLYHSLPGSKAGAPRFGLLRSQLGLVLSDRLAVEDDDSVSYDVGSSRVPVEPLPEEEEPLWGMPVTLE